MRKALSSFMFVSGLIVALFSLISAQDNASVKEAQANLFYLPLISQVSDSENSNTANPPSEVQAAASPANSDWLLVFQEDFNGSTLDQHSWNTCYPWGDGIDCQLGEEYALPENVVVQNGKLQLKAEKRHFTAPNGKVYDYASGMISSHYKFFFLYGYWEARMKVPHGKGLWPAFWSLLLEHPRPGEIDAMEILGHDTKTAYMTLHDASNKSSGGSWTSAVDLAADWHIYGVDWAPGRLTWYIDGVKRFEVTGDSVPDRSIFLLMDLAVGGQWPGSPDNTTPFPSYVEVDYIKVWQHNLAKNPELDSGAMNWAVSKHAGADGNLSVVNGGLSGSNAAKVTITNPGTELWHLQLVQPFALVKGKLYEISFLARADAPRPLAVLLQQGNAPFTEYWNSGELTLSTESAAYGPFVVKSPVTDGGAFLEFNVGKSTAPIYIDRVLIRAIN